MFMTVFCSATRRMGLSFADFSYYMSTNRSSRLRCSVRKDVLSNFAKFTGNTCARVSILLKLQVWPATLLKWRLWRRCFPVNFAKFLRTPFFRTHLGNCFQTNPQTGLFTFTKQIVSEEIHCLFRIGFQIYLLCQETYKKYFFGQFFSVSMKLC